MQIIGALLVLVFMTGGAVAYGRSRTAHIASAGSPRAARTARGVQRQARVMGGKAQEILAEAHATDWLERRRRSRSRSDSRRATARRAARSAAAGTGAALRASGRGARSAGRSAASRLVVPGGTFRPERDGVPAAAASTLPAGGSRSWPSRPAAATTATPNGTNGRTPVPMTTTAADPVAPAGGAGADLFTAIQGLTSRILAGNLRAKQGGIMALGDGMDYVGQSLDRLGTALSEPGQRYPASIWEPIKQAAAHLKAATTACAESSSSINALAAMSVGELTDSATKAPDASQLDAA